MKQVRALSKPYHHWYTQIIFRADAYHAYFNFSQNSLDSALIKYSTQYDENI